MTAPDLTPRLVLPTDSDIPMTYDELIDTISCLCSVGGVIRPSTLPSATINLGDVLVDQAKLLSAFTSMYGFIAAILRMISCIMDVLCALTNPFATIRAVIRLFGTCLPDLILIFPQITVTAIIICIIKIILAIVEYITTVIVPILEEIIQDVQDLTDAFAARNKDAQAAVAFKLASLFKELYNILGILKTLDPIIEMIKTLIDMAVNLPCKGSGGSCDGCGDDQCPEILQQTEIDGTDGIMIVISNGDDPTDFLIMFNSPVNYANFLSLRSFFPRGVDYNEFKDAEDIPYTIEVNNTTYGVSSIDSGGNLHLFNINQELSSDGYLTYVAGGGLDNIRFSSPTADFSSIGEYITISDPQNAFNNGNWEVAEVYDAYNVRLNRTDGQPWIASDETYWKMTPLAPSPGVSNSFTFGINHAELIRHDIIGLGCHPAVKSEINGLEERFGDILDLDVPDFPEIDTDALEDAIIVPKDVTTDYILDNYDSLTPETISQMGSDIEGILNGYSNDVSDYAKDTYVSLFDPEATTLEATPLTQVVGDVVTVNMTVYDRFGGILGSGFAENIVEAEIAANQGTISSTEPVLNDSGTITGVFTATLKSDVPQIITLTASVAGVSVSDYLGNVMVPKEVQVEFEFVSAAELQRRRGIAGEASIEPLGKVRSE